jgi:hypothetical protein
MQTQRRIRAQDRYAQGTIDYLWEHKEKLCEETSDGLFYRGSIHNLVKEIYQSAQAGDVVNILRKSGAVSSVSHGLWEIRRKTVLTDEEGNAIEFDVASYGHDSARTMQERNIRELGKRLEVLEANYEALTVIVVELAKEAGLSVDERSNTKEEVSDVKEGDQDNAQ